MTLCVDAHLLLLSHRPPSERPPSFSLSLSARSLSRSLSSTHPPPEVPSSWRYGAGGIGSMADRQACSQGGSLYMFTLGSSDDGDVDEDDVDSLMQRALQAAMFTSRYVPPHFPFFLPLYFSLYSEC